MLKELVRNWVSFWLAALLSLAHALSLHFKHGGGDKRKGRRAVPRFYLEKIKYHAHTQ